MRLRLITPAVGEPVTLAEVKAHLHETTANHDALLTTYLAAARGQLDGRNGFLGRALLTQTWELVLDAFPVCNYDPPYVGITLPLPPLQSVTSIRYQSSANVDTLLAATSYVLDTTSTLGRVLPTSSWPSTYSTPNAVTIRFVAGYGLAADVPDPIKAAIKLRVQSLFDNLEAEDVAAVERTMGVLLTPYRISLP